MKTESVSNAQIANLFREAAELLEFETADPYRVLSYRRAATTLDELDKPVATLLDEGQDLVELPTVGLNLAGKIEEALRTGTFELLEELRQQTEPILALMMNIPGVGPKRARLLRDELGIATPSELEAAARSGRLRALPGLGKRTETAILDHLARAKQDPRPPRARRPSKPRKARASV